MEIFKIIVVSIGFGLIILMIFARFIMKKNYLGEENLKIMNLNETNFDIATKDKIVLVDFWAEWCFPCKLVAPILNELANELTDDMVIGKINVEEQQFLASRFNVRNIPTLIIFLNGKEVKRLVGAIPKDQLLHEMKNIQQNL